MVACWCWRGQREAEEGERQREGVEGKGQRERSRGKKWRESGCDVVGGGEEGSVMLCWSWRTGKWERECVVTLGSAITSCWHVCPWSRVARCLGGCCGEWVYKEMLGMVMVVVGVLGRGIMLWADGVVMTS